MGEFGRTPRFGQFTGNGVNETGRDHWSQCYSLVIAGGRQPGGRIIGRSDRFAAYPADEPITPQDLAASLLHALGVDPATGSARRLHADGTAQHGTGETGFVWRLMEWRGGSRVMWRGDI